MRGARIGNFQIVGTLGSGAHSRIMHIRRSADGKNYALKVVPVTGPQDAKYVEQARHEFRIAQLLDHPNLIKIDALETNRDWLLRVRNLHLLIEYVNGRTLDTIRPLPLPKLVQVFTRIASGMAHMHRRHVYHADLKPNNLLVSRAGEVKIIDFGLARVKGEARERVQGTPEYMAPEQAKSGVVNEQTDIYNFGATMYRLTTFQLPPIQIVAAGGLPLDAKSWKHLFKPVQEINVGVPPELSDLIHQCLAFLPNQRPERIGEVHDTLKRLAKDLIRSPEDQLEGIELEL